MENLKENLYVKAASNLYRVLLKTTDRQNNIQRVLCIHSSVVDDVTSNLPLRFSSTMDAGTQCSFLSRKEAEQAIGTIRHNPSLIKSGIPNENYELIVNHGRGTSRRQYVDVNTNIGKVLIRQETLDMVTTGKHLHKQFEVRPKVVDPNTNQVITKAVTRSVSDYKKYDPNITKAIKDKTSQLIEIPDDIKNFPWRDLKAFLIDQRLIELYSRSMGNYLPKLIEAAPEVITDLNQKLSQVIAFLKDSKENNITWNSRTFESICPEEITTLLNEIKTMDAPNYLGGYVTARELKEACQFLLYPEICHFDSYRSHPMHYGWILKMVDLTDSFDKLISTLQDAINNAPANLEKLKSLLEQLNEKVTNHLPFTKNGIHKHYYEFSNGYIYMTGTTSVGTHYIRSIRDIPTDWFVSYSKTRTLDWYVKKVDSIIPLNFDKIYNTCPLTLNEIYTTGISDQVTKYLRRIIKEYEGEHYMNSKFKFESISEAIERHELDSSCYYIRWGDDNSYMCLGAYNRQENAFEVTWKSGQGAGMGRNQKIQFLSREDAEAFINMVVGGNENLVAVPSRTSSRGIKVPLCGFTNGRPLVWVNELAFKSLSDNMVAKIMNTCPELKPQRFDSIGTNRQIPNNVSFTQTSEMPQTMYMSVINYVSTKRNDPNYRYAYSRRATLEKVGCRFTYLAAILHRTPEGQVSFRRDQALFMNEEEARRAGEETLESWGHRAREEHGDYIDEYEIEVVTVNDLPAGTPIHGIKVTPQSTTFWFITEPSSYNELESQGFGSYFSAQGIVPWDPRHEQSFNYNIPNDRFRFE